MAVPGATWKPAPAGTKWKYKSRIMNGLENFVDPAIIPLSERTDLPPEVTAILLTPENIASTGKGGLKSSRWYTPKSELPTPPRSVTSSDSSFLDPAVKEFTPTKTSDSRASLKSDLASTYSSLNPTVGEFTPANVSHCVITPKSVERNTSSPLDPSAKDFIIASMARVTDANVSRTPAISQGLAASRWAESGSKSSNAKTVAVVELDPASPVKARDIPVHLRGYYIPPHLRPAGLKALPGKPLLPFIEPHQRAGILPEVIPNDSGYQTPSSETSHAVNCEHTTPKSQYSSPSSYKAPPTSPTTGTGNKSGSEHKIRVPYLASTFEEFIGRKIEVPAVKPTSTIPLATAANITRQTIQLPPDCYSTKLVPGRDVPKPPGKEKLPPGASWPVQEALPKYHAEEGQIDSEEHVEEDKQPELVEPKVLSTVQMPPIDTRVQQTDREFVNDVQEIILFEAMKPKPGILDLTRDALIRETGGAPKDNSSSGVSQFISDDGIEIHSASEEFKSPNNPPAHFGDSRGYLAELDDTLQQGDGSWMPVPCSWENGRPTFQNAFVPQYVAMWAKTIPLIDGKVDTNRDEFKSGLSPLSHLSFEEPLAQPLCYPDVEQSDNATKQLVQTAEIDSRAFANRMVKKQRMRERQSQIAAQQQFYINEEIMANPNTPKIDIYLRPAQMKDIPGITSIYNHYVLNSIIPEDQSAVSDQDMQTVLKDAQAQGLPFIVAVKGRVPPGGNIKSAEKVLGFAYVEFYNYSLAGTVKGASRFTGVIQLYVEPNHTRKGVGRSLMDRILVCSSSTHASKEGYDWINPNAREGEVYCQQGGAHKFHQLFIHRAIEIRGDSDHEWFKQWLHNKFFIEEVARLKSVRRSSSVGTTARMLDVLTFQFEAALAGGFDITC